MLSVVSADVVFRGGRRLGLSAPSVAQVEHGVRVDAALSRILGGVPSGRPWPDPPVSAVVIPFPVRRVDVGRAA